MSAVDIALVVSWDVVTASTWPPGQLLSKLGHLCSVAHVSNRAVLSSESAASRRAHGPSHLEDRNRSGEGGPVRWWGLQVSRNRHSVSICKQNQAESPMWALALVVALCWMFYWVRGCDEHPNLWTNKKD